MRRVISTFTVFLVIVYVITGAAAAPSSSPVPPTAVAPDNYVLGAGDQVEITVFGQPDLTTTATIRPDGMIALPLVKDVKAAGKTAPQLEAELTGLYKRYLKAPLISVAVRQFQIITSTSWAR